MKGKLSLAVVVCLFLVGFVQAQNNLRVNETETQAVFLANQLNTNLIVENSAQSFSAKIRLEVLDADDKILAQSETVETIKRGKHGLPIPLNFTQTQVADNLLWYRLRYAIRRENSPISTDGIVSLSEIMLELFELQISASDKVFAGMRFRAHVLALHPLTKKPIKNVNIAGEVLLDDELKINAVGKTNGEGFAALDFEIPQTAKLDDDGDITIKGEKNGVTREAKEDLDVPTESFVYLNLDKPIYQPNQKLFARGLYLNQAKRPLKEKELDFEIVDEDGETVYEETVKTSRFGVATVGWQIPANFKLGEYRLEVKNDDDDFIGGSVFKITRYDLPNFSVNAKTDKPFYLPEQKTAEISVGADYLFGKPVTKGKVRVVEETERRWNYKAQKWEIEEAKSYEGVLNEEGKFTAQIDLSEAHENLSGDNWKRFEDLHFAAYFTDASTNRTEQKRFDVRITKEAIHIYFIRHDADVNPKLPFQFYVSTFYADGNPARCSIYAEGRNTTVRECEKSLKQRKTRSLTVAFLPVCVETKTNSYGAGKLEIRIPEKPFPEAGDRYFLQISARDKQGNGGTFADSIYLDEKEKQIRVKTDKTIYLPEENIEAKIFSTETDATVLVDVVQNSSVVYSKRVKLDDGRGSLQIPFRPDFKGELTISAYFKDEDESYPIYFAKTVIFPAQSDLKFNIKSLKTVYRPNEEAKISFNIRDGNGNATLKFKLADSLTTWKLYAVASTETGEVGLVEKELQTFQPFFAELEPPKILTEGDEIALPVPVRNYTDSRQKVAVSMAENSWSSLAGGSTQQIEIAPNNSQNAIFNFRAASPVKDGKQKVTAVAKGEGDAIEKSVTVKPNGKEIVETQSKLFRDNAVFDVNFPANSFPNTRQADLKIYPNMLAHVAESVEGLLKRPYGCGEQTTSSTYPNLMILKIEKELGKSVNAKVKAQTNIYLQEGYERLLNYQTASGGFSYWGKNDLPNVALTAYILRFLNDAKDFIAVDGQVVENANNWLLTQQQTDGSWKTNYIDTDSSTAYVAHSLALRTKKDEETKKHLVSGLEFLKKRLPEIKDAYILANFALASIATGDTDTAKIIADKLNSLSQADKETIFWTTANTPFYGWGTTAKIETTALVMQTFLRLNEAGKFATPLSRGLAFLLKNKDKYGVWFSTQTTVNVLDALILLQKSIKNTQPNLSEKAEVFINGKKIQDFAVNANSLSNPILIDISPYLSETANRVEIKNADNSNFMQAQIVAAHYISWKDVAEESDYFDLQINFDKTEAKIGEEINCSVKIARKTARYGMILAEIGIPPGADVNRASLEKAKAADEFSSFDILPDKIIVYLWTNSVPTEFNFKFRPRYGINAQNAPSVVYDYYNAEANATVAPVQFSIR